MTNSVMASVQLRLSVSQQFYSTNNTGKFEIMSDYTGEVLFTISYDSYKSLSMSLELKDTIVDLGTIYLELDVMQIQQDNQIVLSELDLEVNDEQSINTGVLGATRDLLARRAAFDFSPVFFKIRGYDSSRGVVSINGIPMNRQFRGRPEWNNWGGLNDVFRNQEHVIGLRASPRHFGDVLGITNISTRPSTLRPGLRFSTSYSNKSYSGRIMTTYNSPAEEERFGYTMSVSRRWTDQGYFDGTNYDAYSVYGALEYKNKQRYGFYLTAFLAANRRGRKAAITDEVFELVGRRYNPYWGFQHLKKRNSRSRYIAEPIVMLNYWMRKGKLGLDLGIAYQWGMRTSSRLGYYNAPNPLPDYYRYLPSYQINNPIGANFIASNTAKTAFTDDSQIDWSLLYHANQSRESNGQASYILYDDTSKRKMISAHGNGTLNLGNYKYLDFGLNFNRTENKLYSKITDLLGAEYHLDVDAFSMTANDLGSELNKEQGDIFGYHYQTLTQHWDLFAQFRFSLEKWNGFVAGKYYSTSYQRDGVFRNERYPENSKGQSPAISFANYGVKAGVSYQLTKRHQFEAYGSHMFRPPVLSQVFVNPRENNSAVKNIGDEMTDSIELAYLFSLPEFYGRLSAYYTRFQDATDINFFYVDSGLGSDFVQQVSTGLDRLHKGLEFGFNYQISSSVNLSAVASISEYLYASNPDLTINFDTAGIEEELINIEGEENLGISEIKGHKLASGPAIAISLGVEYRDPKYWWFGSTLNRLSENYISISPITRTKSFSSDPETEMPFPAASEENIRRLLVQKPLEEVFLLNINAGKSWIWGKTYISLFGSITNLLDENFRTGGYEQSRNGNFGQLVNDNLGGNPSFGPKYWFGYGRTVFLNISVSI